MISAFTLKIPEVLARVIFGHDEIALFEADPDLLCGTRL
jgi:hypothetical protein